MDEVIQRIRELFAQQSGPPFPPATQADITDAEARLGFALPANLRRLYTEVANGGFGPIWGFAGLPGGATNEQGHSVVEMYLDDRRYFADTLRGFWPERLLPVCNYGCGIWWCVDCAHPDAPVVWCDPNPGGPCESWFEPLNTTLAEWLADWLAGRRICGRSATPNTGAS